MSDRKILHVIDGSGYIYRAYYAIRALSTAAGEPTNAVYGFATMIQRLLDGDKPEYVAITFDPGRDHTFRRKIYPEYKANRSAPPEDLPPQIPRIHEVVESFRIPQYKVDGFEADDVIATLTRLALENDFDVRLITGDKDLMQLVTDRVTVWEPMREKRYGPREVEEKFAVPPEKLGALLALAGDASDNIPGVRGVGPKTAAKLLTAYGDINGVLEAAKAGKIKGKMGEKIVACEDDARLSERLVKLEDHVPVDVDIESLKYLGPDLEAQRTLFKSLEFTRLLERASGEGSKTAGPATTPSRAQATPTIALDHNGYSLVTTASELDGLVARLAKSGRFSLCLEHETTKIPDTTIHGMALSDAPGQAVYIPLAHDDPKYPAQLTLQVVMAALKPALEDAAITKVCSNSKAWYALCALHDVALSGVTMDTSLASYLHDPEDRYDQSSAIAHGADDGPHGSGDVARKFLGIKTIARSSVTGRGRDRKKFGELPVEAAAPFVSERADVTLRAADTVREALQNGELLNVLTDLELPLAPVIARLESTGIRVDLAMLADMKSVFAAEIERLTAVCYEAAGQEFKLNSPTQLRKVLFEDLGLKIIKRTKTGPSTDQSVLEELSSLHPLPAAILEYRQVTKLQSTYVQALPKMVSARTGRVHTTLGQTVAATGRLSSTEPNLQNIPIRTELGRQLRKVFVPADGHRLISVDYSQIELRVLAHYSQEPVLVEAFAHKQDIHTRTASVLFEISPDEVTREQRGQAKAVNFGVLYGMGPVRLARQLDLPRRTASGFIKDYFERQPRVRDFLDKTLEDARENGYVRTVLGRRRWVRDITSNSRGARAAAERVATNTPIQGTAADLIKLAMIRVAARLEQDFPQARLLLQVHDELLLEAPEVDAEAVAALVKAEMEGAYPLDVPLVAEAHTGANWQEAH